MWTDDRRQMTDTKWWQKLILPLARLAKKNIKMWIFFRNQPIRNKNCLWQPCLLTDRDKMSNLYRGSTIDASYQVSVHLGKWFQRRSYLEIDQSETRIVCGGHVCYWIGTKWIIFIEDLQRMFPVKFGFIWPSGFRGFFFFIKFFFRNQPVRKMNCLWWPYLFMDRDKNEQSLERTFHRCFLPSVTSFGLGVSEEKIKMWKLTDDRRWTTDDGRQVMAKAHITFCKVS
jgi:hypothetical protein